MKSAFWDSSALVPLCVQQKPSISVRRLLKQYQIVVWWATPVEMRSAFERLTRLGESTPTAAVQDRIAEAIVVKERSFRKFVLESPLPEIALLEAEAVPSTE